MGNQASRNLEEQRRERNGITYYDRGTLTGKSGRNINVNFNGDAADVSKIIPVRVTGAGSNTLRGEKEI